MHHSKTHLRYAKTALLSSALQKEYSCAGAGGTRGPSLPPVPHLSEVRERCRQKPVINKQKTLVPAHLFSIIWPQEVHFRPIWSSAESYVVLALIATFHKPFTDFYCYACTITSLHLT